MVRVLTLLIAGSLLASCAVFQPIGDFLLENTAPTALPELTCRLDAHMRARRKHVPQ